MYKIILNPSETNTKTNIQHLIAHKMPEALQDLHICSIYLTCKMNHTFLGASFSIRLSLNSLIFSEKHFSLSTSAPFNHLQIKYISDRKGIFLHTVQPVLSKRPRETLKSLA